MPISIDELDGDTLLELHSKATIKVREYLIIRSLITKKCKNYIVEPSCNNRNNPIDEERYKYQLDEFLKGLEKIALYCEEHSIDYDKMCERYGPPVIVDGYEDPWYFSRDFEAKRGLMVVDFTGQYPVTIKWSSQQN